MSESEISTLDVPSDIFDISFENIEFSTPSYSFSDIGFKLNANPISFAIDHPDYGLLFDSRDYPLLFYDKYIELTWEF